MSLGVLKSIDVDFSESSTYQYVTIFSDEIYSRTIEVNPLNNGAEYIIPQDTVARLEARKPDNKPIILDCEIDYSANKIYVNLTPRCTDTPGVTDCQIGLYGVDNRFIASTHFFIDVYRSALSGNGSATGCGCGDTVECSGEYQSFRVALLSLDEVQKRATAAIDEINHNAGNANEATNRANAAADRADKVADDLATELEQARAFNDVASKSERLRGENEAIRISSEELRQTNESARASSEEERAASEAIRAGNEYNRMSSETKRADAELLRSDAEKARDSAEDARIASEKSRASAEADRKTSERERAAAELARDAEEITRVMNEDRRKEAETERESSEASRKEGESERETAENLRADAEAERAAAEILRINAEEEREIAEELRIDAEEIRLAAETERAAAESLRAEAESVREQGYRRFDGRIAENAARVSANHKRITNLERRLSDEMFLTDGEVAYQRSVPNDALPFASLAEIGGMTRKCTNLIPFPYQQSSIEDNGVKFIVNNDGSVTLSGTPTGAAAIIIYRGVLPNVLTDKFTISLSGTFSNAILNVDLRDVSGEILLTTAGAVVTVNKADYPTASTLTIMVKREINGAVMSGDCYPMLNEGEAELPYEPYFEGLRDAKVTAVESVGANLIPFPYASGGSGSAVENNGVTFTVNADRSITINGTATDAGAVFILQRDAEYGERMDAMGRDYVTNGDYTISKRLFYNRSNKILSINIAADSSVNETIYPMLNKGDTALPYRPYFKSTFPISEAVQSLEGYGQGVNAECYNKIVLDPANGAKKFVRRTKRIVFDGTTTKFAGKAGAFNGYHIRLEDIKHHNNNYLVPEILCSHADAVKASEVNERKDGIAQITDYVYFILNVDTVEDANQYLADQYAAGTPVTVEYVLAEPIETDIGEYVSDDNFIGVEGGGTITAVNEYSFDVPLTVEYMLKEATV